MMGVYRGLKSGDRIAFYVGSLMNHKICLSPLFLVLVANSDVLDSVEGL